MVFAWTEDYLSSLVVARTRCQWYSETRNQCRKDSRLPRRCEIGLVSISFKVESECYKVQDSGTNKKDGGSALSFLIVNLLPSLPFVPLF